MTKVYRSKCCNAEVKTEGMPDFFGSKKICTFYFSCFQCGKPCDVQEKRLDSQGEVLQKLVEFLDGITIHPTKGVILTLKKKRQLIELQKMEWKLSKSKAKKSR